MNEKQTTEEQEGAIEKSIRHKAHQEMLDQHRANKQASRFNHRKGFHKIKIIPIQLV